MSSTSRRTVRLDRDVVGSLGAAVEPLVTLARRLAIWLLAGSGLLVLGACNSRGTCVQAPTLTSSDLTCESDQDCTTVWTGTICSCDCKCPTAAGNNAARARMEAALSAELMSTCGPDCPCGGGVPRCLAHQCTVCDYTGPPECRGDAGAGD
jgi:hypothetical protein